LNHIAFKPITIVCAIALSFLIQNICCPEVHSFTLNESVTAFPEPDPDWKIFSKSLKVSPDSTILAVVAKKGDHMAVIRNGVLQKTFAKIGRATPVFSPDSSVMAYTGYNNGQWHMVVNETVHPGFKAVAPPLFSSDGKHLAYGVQDGLKQRVILDAKQGPEFDGILLKPGHFIFSPDSSRLAYIAAQDKKMLVVDNGKSDKPFDMAAKPAFSPNSKRLVCTVKNGDQWHVLENGKIGPGFDAIDVPFFSPDSKQLAYIATVGKEMLLAVDGEKGSTLDGVANPVFSPDSSRLAYIGVDGQKWFVVLDGKQGERFDRIGAFEFSRDSKHIAYSAQNGDDWMMIFDGKDQGEFDIVSIPVFSSDSATLAYAAKKGDRWQVVVNGTSGTHYDAVTLPVFSPDGSRVVYMAQKADKWSVIVDGQEGPWFDGTSMATFSPDSKHMAYLVKRGQVWSLAVDGVPGEKLFLGGVKGAALVFDSDTRFHTLVMGVDGHAFARVDVEIEELCEI